MFYTILSAMLYKILPYYWQRITQLFIFMVLLVMVCDKFINFWPPLARSDPLNPLKHNLVLKLKSRGWICMQSIKFDQASICRVSKLDSIELDSILKLLTRGLPLLVRYSTWSPTLSALYSSQDDRVLVITWIHKYHTTINIKHAHSFQGIIFCLERFLFAVWYSLNCMEKESN